MLGGAGTMRSGVAGLERRPFEEGVAHAVSTCSTCRSPEAGAAGSTVPVNFAAPAPDDDETPKKPYAYSRPSLIAMVLSRTCQLVSAPVGPGAESRVRPCYPEHAGAPPPVVAAYSRRIRDPSV
jgi:hypothetical protein